MTRSTEDLSRELDRLRRQAQTQERLAGVARASPSLSELLQRLLELFMEVGAVDVAVLRMREGDRLRSRAAIGVEEEVAAGFSVPISEGLPGENLREAGSLLLAADARDGCGSTHLAQKGVRRLYCMPLLQGGDLVAAVYLGTRDERELAEETREVLAVLAAGAGTPILHAADREALREEVRSRDAVLGVVAHDLRNPLNVISLAANNLRQRLRDSGAQRSVDRILRGAQRADRLIQDLLEISAIGDGQFSIEVQPMETVDAILAALESQESIAAEASIILGTDISPELPPIEADAERILEVLENLIGNAIKFTGPSGTITVGASAGENEILLWVKDTGSGIADAQVPHLFDRFWQANKKDRRGTGLGLTICKAIVEAHGGRIWPQSKVGEGTTMFFTLPARMAPPKNEVAPVATLLLVDDRPENIVALKAILERPSYRLVTATSGAEALSAVLRESVSVVLLDIAMPGMNGLEVAVHLKELDRSREIPIIFITAFGDDPQEIHRAYAAGGADYLVKPLDAEIVRKKVAVFVDLARRRRASRAGDKPHLSLTS